MNAREAKHMLDLKSPSYIRNQTPFCFDVRKAKC